MIKITLESKALSENLNILKNIVIGAFSLVVLIGCNKRKLIKSEQGGIDIITNVYFNASKGLDDNKHIFISKLNYKGDTIVELIPNVEMPDFTEKIYVIRDSLYCEYVDTQNILFSDLNNKSKAKNIKNKVLGAVWSDEKIPLFEKRINVNDTLLFGKKMKRFKIDTKEYFSMYYFNQTDTLLPFSVYNNESEIYTGRLERIDTYNKKKDIFISIKILPRKHWDDEAKDIFDFNSFIKKSKTNK